MRRSVVLALVGVVSAGPAALAQTATQPPAGVPVPNVSLDQARKAGPGTLVRVVGFVIGSYRCPPCPPGATCKPCAAPSEVFVAVAANHPRVVLLDAASDVLAIATDKPDAFAIGSDYRFEITTADRAKDGIDARLVRFQRPTDPLWPDASTERPGVVPFKP